MKMLLHLVCCLHRSNSDARSHKHQVLQTIKTAAAWFIQICNCMRDVPTVSHMIPEGTQQDRRM